MIALGGFREGTLARLRYRHVCENLERGIVPIHVHVEAAITKGKYHHYETFLGAEVISYLRLCLDKRRQDSPDEKVPAEEIVDDSPLIRNAQSAQPKPVGEKARAFHCQSALIPIVFGKDTLQKFRCTAFRKLLTHRTTDAL